MTVWHAQGSTLSQINYYWNHQVWNRARGWSLKFSRWFSLMSRRHLPFAFIQLWTQHRAPATCSHIPTCLQGHLKNICQINSCFILYFVQNKIWKTNLPRLLQIGVKPEITLTKIIHVLMALPHLQSPEKSSQLCWGILYVFRNKWHSPLNEVW